MGMFGIIVMVLENELSSAGVYTKVSECARQSQGYYLFVNVVVRVNATSALRTILIYGLLCLSATVARPCLAVEEYQANSRGELTKLYLLTQRLTG